MKSVPIRRAGNRNLLLFGADRELALFLCLVCGVLVVSVMEWRAAVVGMVIWFLGLAGLRLMAKADPKMRFVALEFLRYQHYYPARSHPMAPSYCASKK